MKSNIILKVICFLFSMIFIMGIFVFPSFADEGVATETEDTTEVLTEPVDKDYQYHSLISEIVYISAGELTNYTCDETFSSVDKPVSKTFTDIMPDGIQKLSIKGFVLTDFGVEKFKVVVCDHNTVNGKTFVYEPRNYLGNNAYVGNGYTIGDDLQYYDYYNNAYYDIDLQLFGFGDGEHCDITVYAITRAGDQIEILNLIDVYPFAVSDEICRYCGGSAYYSIADPDLYSHNYHQTYYYCNTCVKSSLIENKHDWKFNETDNIYHCNSCKASSSTGPNCTYSDVIYTVYDSYYHEAYQQCDVCGDNLNIKSHNFSGDKCEDCGYELVNSDINTPDDNDDNISNVPSTNNSNKDDNDISIIDTLVSYFEDFKGLFALFFMIDLILIIFVVVKSIKRRK